MRTVSQFLTERNSMWAGRPAHMLFRSVKSWLTVLILALVALAMLVAWVYVVPPLANRLDRQKLTDQRLSASVISSTVANSGVYYLGNRSMGVSNEALLARTVTVIGMQFNARVVLITMNQAIRQDSGGVNALDLGDYTHLTLPTKRIV